MTTRRSKKVVEVKAPSAPTSHSEIGASSYYRWKACPGSVRLSRGIKGVESKYAAEGTEAHALAARILECELAGQSWADPDVDIEMLSHVSVYVDEVLRLWDKGRNKVLIEHGFNLESVFPGLFGTCDAIVFDERAKTLHVLDLKFGAGIPVEVEDNEQLQYYGLGALLSTNFGCDSVVLTIVQPRCDHPDGPVRRWVMQAIDMLDFAAQLETDAAATQVEGAVVKPGDHCRFCNAAGICPALKEKARALARLEFGAAPVAGKPYDPAELAETLAWLSTLETWAESVRSFAYAEAMAGRPLPGWKLVEKRAIRKWIDTDEAEKGLRLAFSDSVVRDCMDPPTLKSPAQVEKIVHAKQWDKVTPFIAKISSGNTLVPESDPRQAIKLLSAKEEFGAAALTD